MAVSERAPALLGQNVVVIGGSSGIGLETARLAHAEGARLFITGRDPEHLRHAASELNAWSATTFDVTDFAALERFFGDLPAPIDHVMVTAGAPTYTPFAEMDVAQMRSALDDHLLVALQVARHAAGRIRPGGRLLLIGGTGGRRARAGVIVSTVTAAMPALTASLALELAPVRVNLIAPGFVDTPLSASILGADLEKRRDQLRATLPIHRVVGPADVAALAVHIMLNTALTGATYDVDGGQQLVEA